MPRIPDHVRAQLDPLLAPALEMERRAILPARAWANDEAAALTSIVERLAARMVDEPDEQSAHQLAHIAEALGACTVSLCAFSRGVVPRIGRKPDLIIRS